jgi:urea carboxylase system permease
MSHGSRTDDDRDLAAFGYKQELTRRFGSFTTFATGFAFISVLTGMFTLFGFAWAAGGPASIWAWVLALGGQLLFAFVFAELAVRYPLQGSVYNWAKNIAPNKGFSWMAGASFTLALIVSATAVALTMQLLLPFISSVFWIYGNGHGSHDAAVNGVILGAIMIALTTTITLLGARTRQLVNNVGVTVELVGIVVLVIVFLFHAHRGPGVAFQTNGTGHQYGLGYIGALLVAVLLGMFVMWGFDTAGSIGEETINPRKTCPPAIIRALVASGVGGFLLLLTAAMAVKNVHDPNISGQGLAYVILSAFGNTGGKIMIACAAIAVFVCGLANQVGAMNMMFAMSRDNALPGARRLARVSKRTKTPVLPPIIVAVAALLLMLLQIDQPALFVALASTSVIFALFSYLLLAGAFTSLRRRGGWKEPEKGYFSLRKFGLPVSLAATVWGIFSIIDIAWPRNAVYDPAAPFHWYLRWFGVIFPVVLLALSFAVYWFRQRHRLGILPEHAADSPRPVGDDRVMAPALDTVV